MDDRFLDQLREEPRPEFAAGLKARLARQEVQARERRAAWPALRWSAAAVTLVAAIGLLFLFPSVRAWAQAFLDQFRVRGFTAVRIDESRLERFRALEQNNTLLVFDRQEEIRRPEPPSNVASRQAAEALVGMPVLVPAFVPAGLAAEKFQATEEGHVRLGTSTARLRAVLDALDLRDVQVPAGLDGQWVDVRLNPASLQRWGSTNRHVELIQARSPEVSLPPGLDLARLGEIGLRILGLEPGEANRIARSIDWTSTLIVPVPATASSFREVTVRGQRALLVSTQETTRPDGKRTRHGATLLWTEGERVLALSGNVPTTDLMQMAESLR